MMLDTLKEPDPYPTRLRESVAMFPRSDCVVHANSKNRRNGPLDEASLAQYEHDGFLWLEEFFSSERVDALRAEFEDLARDHQLPRSGRVVMDPQSGELRSIFGVHQLTQRFDQLTRDPRILGMVRQLLGGDVYIHQSRINAKQGFWGSGFSWHSDFETWHAEDGMPRMRAVSVSLMITDNNEFNAPLMLIPGSHHYFVPTVGVTPEAHWRTSLKAQQCGLPSRTALRQLVNQGGIQAPKGSRGSLLLFECNTLHGSNKNLSPWPRSNLFVVYNSVANYSRAPYSGGFPRPNFLGERRNRSPLADAFTSVQTVFA